MPVACALCTHKRSLCVELTSMLLSGAREYFFRTELLLMNRILSGEGLPGETPGHIAQLAEEK